VRAASELHARDVAHPADQLAQEKECRWGHHEADQRHDGILNDHDDRQPDQRHQIAADSSDQQIDHLADGGSAGRQPRDKFG
jgi:hypothetical protein